MYADVTLPSTVGTGQDLGFIARRPSIATRDPSIRCYIEPLSGNTMAHLVLFRSNASGTAVDSASAASDIPWEASQTRRLLLEVTGSTCSASVQTAGGGTVLSLTSMTLTDLLGGQDALSFFYATTGSGQTFAWDNWTVEATGSHLDVDGQCNATALRVNNTYVVGPRLAGVSDVVTSGTTVDLEARTAINSILARLRSHGLIDS
jgi:hypothetical protein